MKRIRNLFTLRPIPIITLLFVSACGNFLDENPDQRVALDRLDNTAKLLVNGYSTASPNFTEWMTDNVQFTTGTNLRSSHEQMFSWEDVTTGPDEQDTPDFYWNETYNSIAHANEVLAALADIKIEPSERARRDAIEGEALLIRAYGHFMLVNLFGEHFSLSSSSKGVPYVKEPETTFLAQYKRESVKKVYNEIEDDLLKGLDLIDDSFYENSGKYHFNRNAALAFASRFYLFKGDFIRCIQFSDELLGANPETYVRDLTGQDFQLVSSSTTEYPRLYTSPDQAANLLLMRKTSLFHRLDFAYGPERTFYSSLFSTSIFGGLTDQRENPAFVKGPKNLFPIRFQSLFERSSLNSNVGFPYHIYTAFTGEEVLLNRAESNAWQNNLDEALADLQVLSERRFSGGTPTITLDILQSFYNSTNDKNNVLSYILFLERRKEFLMQGLRWFDLKRYTHQVTRILSNGSSITLEKEDLRKVLQIPQSAIDVGGLTANPR